MDKHWSRVLSHALGTPWQQLLLGWQTAALQQLREQILFSNRPGLREAGFKMDPPLDPALTATVSPSWSWPRKARHPPEANSITYTTTEFVSLSADRCNHAA